jgi:hypothetical protein
VITGCASFKSTTRIDVGPFAENTLGLIGEVQRTSRPIVWGLNPGGWSAGSCRPSGRGGNTSTSALE